jgi:hypothetical protein
MIRAVSGILFYASVALEGANIQIPAKTFHVLGKDRIKEDSYGMPRTH